jgi:predicted ATPase
VSPVPVREAHAGLSSARSALLRFLTFKHALTHDVAYAGLLGERRRALHGAAAVAIEHLHANRLAEHVERLAHHAQGEVWDKAVRYLRQAGTKGFLRSAHREGAACFEQALDALQRLPAHRDTIAESLDLRFDLRTALMPLGEFGRLWTVLDEAEALAEAVGDQRRLGHALNYKAMQFVHADDLATALKTARRALAIGESEPDVAHGVQVVHWVEKARGGQQAVVQAVTLNGNTTDQSAGRWLRALAPSND